MPKFSQRSLMQHEREIGAGDSMRQAAKPVDEHRYPRGYTPERQAAVSSAIRDESTAGTSIQHETHVQYHSPDSDKSPYLSSKKFYGAREPGHWSRDHDSIVQAQQEQAHRVHTDALARSTVPLEHMSSLPSFHIQAIQGAAGSYASPMGDEGKLTRWENGVPVHDSSSNVRGRITIDPNTTANELNHTLVHEIGHHIDHQNDPRAFYERSSGERVPTAFGGSASPSLEGYAEGYAQRHARNRDGSQPYLSYREFIPQASFADRYHQASGGMKAHEHSSAQPGGQTYSRPPDVHEPRLFQRDADISSTRTEDDFGQHPLSIPWADRDPNHYDPVSLGTIKTGRGVPENRAAEGFHPGDAHIAAALSGGMASAKYAIPLEERNRVASAWNQRFDDRRLNPD